MRTSLPQMKNGASIKVSTKLMSTIQTRAIDWKSIAQEITFHYLEMISFFLFIFLKFVAINQTWNAGEISVFGFNLKSKRRWKKNGKWQTECMAQSCILDCVFETHTFTHSHNDWIPARSMIFGQFVIRSIHPSIDRSVDSIFRQKISAVSVVLLLKQPLNIMIMDLCSVYTTMINKNGLRLWIVF